ncbi:PASTA domain-containing protein [Streptomyces sp. NPDC003042]
MATLTFGSGPGVTPANGQAAGQVGIPHNLLGRSKAKAEKRLKGLGLVPQLREVVTDGDADVVFGVVPPPGSIVPAGSVVTVYVATAAPGSVDLNQKLERLLRVVATLETEAAANKRQTELLSRLDQIVDALSEPGGASTAFATTE